LPQILEVDLRFLSISFGSGVGVIDGDDLVITLKRSMPEDRESYSVTHQQREEADRKNLFFELEEIYRKLSFRKTDK